MSHTAVLSIDSPQLIHWYDFEDGTCNDKIDGDTAAAGVLHNNAYIMDGKVIFNTQSDHLQLPKNILSYPASTPTAAGAAAGSLTKAATIEIFLSINNTRNHENSRWARIFQFGKFSENNSFSFAVDRCAADSGKSLMLFRPFADVAAAGKVKNHFNKIMLEYFPMEFPYGTISNYQAYSDFNFNDEDGQQQTQKQTHQATLDSNKVSLRHSVSLLYIVAVITPGSKLRLYINSRKYESAGAVPHYSEENIRSSFQFNYIGKSLDPGQLGFIGSVDEIRIYRGQLSEATINQTYQNYSSSMPAAAALVIAVPSAAPTAFYPPITRRPIQLSSPLPTVITEVPTSTASTRAPSINNIPTTTPTDITFTMQPTSKSTTAISSSSHFPTRDSVSDVPSVTPTSAVDSPQPVFTRSSIPSAATNRPAIAPSLSIQPSRDINPAEMTSSPTPGASTRAPSRGSAAPLTSIVASCVPTVGPTTVFIQPSIAPTLTSTSTVNSGQQGGRPTSQVAVFTGVAATMGFVLLIVIAFLALYRLMRSKGNEVRTSSGGFEGGLPLHRSDRGSMADADMTSSIARPSERHTYGTANEGSPYGHLSSHAAPTPGNFSRRGLH